MLATFCVYGTILGLPEVDPDVRKIKQTSEPEGRSLILGNAEPPLTVELLSMDSMGLTAILGNGQSDVRCSKVGSYRTILDPAFSMSPKIIPGWVNMYEDSIWGT